MKHKIWQMLFILLLLLLLDTIAITVTADGAMLDLAKTEEAQTIREDNDPSNRATARAATSYTTVITVTTTSDTSGDSQTATCYYDGSIYFSTPSCSFRRALVEAMARPAADRPVLIAFNIPVTDTNYSREVSGTWTIMIDADLPALTTEYLVDRDNGLTTIDGDTQPGGRTDDPKIIFLDSDDSDATNYSLEVESGQNTIRNISWRGGGMIFLKEVSGRGGYNTVDNVWIGLSDDGQELAFRDPDDKGRLATGGGVKATSDGNTIRNNAIAGAYALAIDIDGGDDNIVESNFVGTRADGTVPSVSEAIKCVRSLTYVPTSWYGGWGIGLSGSRNQIISNTIAGLHRMQTANETPPIALDIYGSDHIIQYNIIGRDGAGSDVGVCGQGMKVAGDSTEILDNTIVDSKPGFTDASNNNPTKGAIYVNDSSPTFDQITIRRNVVITSPEEVIEFGPSIPDALRLFEPAQVTQIDGTEVEGTNGDGSPCPGCLIDLYLDDRNDNQEALEWLTSATADSNGDFTATLPRSLTGSEGIRTSSTSQDYFVIGDYGPGTTTDLSELYVPGGVPDAPTALSIAGPTIGQTGVSHAFTITVYPISVTLPLTYSVDTDGGTPSPPPMSIDQRIVSPSFTWATSGTKTLWVTATNESGTVTGTHTIFITDTMPGPVAPTAVTITGPETGQPDELYTFVITVDPVDVATPIWYGVDYTDLGSPLTGFLDQRVVYLRNRTWSTTGTKVITVAAINETRVMVTDTHTIVITDAVPTSVAPVTVTITGPETGQLGVPYTFTVAVDPEGVTTPITYEIQYTDGSAPLGPFNLNQRVVDTPSITWATTGTKTIWVQATNEEGSAIGTHEIAISEEPATPQTKVILTGPASGLTNTPYTFTATISPTTASVPITYTFEASDGLGPTSEQLAHTNPIDWPNVEWTVPGTKTVTVTAQNADGTYIDTHIIEIDSGTIFLPLVIRNY